jgi:hypothetical protein
VVAYIRRVRTASGATAVQIAEYAEGRERVVEHVGSAHTVAGLGVLLERARERLVDPAQEMFDFEVEAVPRTARLMPAPADPTLLDEPCHDEPAERDGTGRVVGTASGVLFDALAGVFADLGFDAGAERHTAPEAAPTATCVIPPPVRQVDFHGHADVGTLCLSAHHPVIPAAAISPSATSSTTVTHTVSIPSGSVCPIVGGSRL